MTKLALVVFETVLRSDNCAFPTQTKVCTAYAETRILLHAESMIYCSKSSCGGGTHYAELKRITKLDKLFFLQSVLFCVIIG